MAIIAQITSNTEWVAKVKELNDNKKGYKAVQYICQKLNITASNQDIWDTVHFCDKFEDLSEFDGMFEGL